MVSQWINLDDEAARTVVCDKLIMASRIFPPAAFTLHSRRREIYLAAPQLEGLGEAEQPAG